jgi:transposase
VSELTKEQLEELTHWAQSRTLPAGDVFRARLMLALAEGRSWSQIEIELQTSRPTIARWKSRFEQQGMAGLDPRHRGSEPRNATPSLQARILRKTTQRPADGGTHWTCRKMATALGLSKSTVQRVWRQARLKPHRLDRYMASDDPRFEEKAADIIGLYMNLSAHKTKAVEEFLEANPKVRFHFTPTYSSWLNQVEIWFSKVEGDVIARGVFTSVADLARKLRKYIRAYGKSAKPFRWHYTDASRRIRPLVTK